MAEVIQAALAETQWHIDAYSELIKRSGEQQLSLINVISDKVVEDIFGPNWINNIDVFSFLSFLYLLL